MRQNVILTAALVVLALWLGTRASGNDIYVGGEAREALVARAMLETGDWVLPLWNGNVVWGLDGTAWLVDPAAHGGHRESDLAMLALFGLPQLPRVLAAYAEVHPLADGWEERVGIHQLFPLLAHAAMFGGGYGDRAARIAHAFL